MALSPCYRRDEWHLRLDHGAGVPIYEFVRTKLLIPSHSGDAVFVSFSIYKPPVFSFLATSKIIPRFWFLQRMIFPWETNFLRNSNDSFSSIRWQSGPRTLLSRLEIEEFYSLLSQCRQPSCTLSSPFVPVPQDSHPMILTPFARSESPVRTLMGTGDGWKRRNLQAKTNQSNPPSRVLEKHPFPFSHSPRRFGYRGEGRNTPYIRKKAHDGRWAFRKWISFSLSLFSRLPQERTIVLLGPEANNFPTDA